MKRKWSELRYNWYGFSWGHWQFQFIASNDGKDGRKQFAVILVVARKWTAEITITNEGVTVNQQPRNEYSVPFEE